MTQRTPYTLALLTALFAVPAVAGAGPIGPNHPTLVAGSGTNRAGFVKAGSSGAEWALPGGPRVIASPDAELRVLGNPQRLTLGAGAATPGYTVVLKRGKISIDCPDDAKSAVVLATPRNLNAIVKTGKVRAIASNSETAIANDWGETSVSASGGAYRPLSAGNVHVASNNDERRIVGSPSSVNGHRVQFAMFGESTLADLSWNDVPGAAGYRIELAKSGESVPLASAQTSAAHLDQPLADLAPGAYEMRLYALDATGLESSKPLAAPIRIVGAELPEGSYLDSGGVIRLAKGQRVRFSGTDGLEMGYGGSSHYFRAAEAAGLVQNEATIVHFRLPGTFDLATARLAPRNVVAKIEMSPGTASWPKDPISIRVRLVDREGNDVPEWLEAIPKVTLGIDPLDVAFERHGDWLEGKVEPHEGGGPWVLRVDVKDQFGAPLGRDFLEIVHEPVHRHRVIVKHSGR